MNKAALLLLVCLGPLALLACSSPDEAPPLPPRASARTQLDLLARIEAAVPDLPEGPHELEVYDVRDLIARVPDFPGDRIRVKGGAHREEHSGVARAAAQDLALEFYDVSDIVGRPPNYPAPELGLNLARAGAAQRASVARVERKEERREERWQRSPLRPHVTRLKVGEREFLPLRAQQASVRIDGFRARVVLDLLFANEHERSYEGTFQLRLPSGATPSFLAFGSATLAALHSGSWVLPASAARSADGAPERVLAARAHSWVRPKVARVVERRRASRAYHDTVRRRVDPALLEWSGAGVFSARVFPLGPQQLHRIVLAYELDLDPSGELRIDLPPGPRTVLDLDVAGSPDEVELSPPAAWTRAGSRVQARLEQPEGPVVVRVARSERILVGGDAAGTFLAVRCRPLLPPPVARPVRRALFLLDASESAKPSYARYLDLLEALLEGGAAREVALLCFDSEAAWWRADFVENTPANRAALLAHARAQQLVGGTDLGAALRAVAPLSVGADVFLLGDGSATWGEVDLAPAAEQLRGPLFAYRGPGADLASLAQLARASGGAVFSLGADLEELGRAHRSLPWQLEGAEIPGASDVLVAGRPTALYSGQELKVVARGRPTLPVLRLSLRCGPERRVLRVPLGPSLASPLAPRAYGEVATGQLEDLVAAPQARLAFARHFRVARRTCSFVMLESEADYRRFGIEPGTAAADVAEIRSESASAHLERASERAASPRGRWLADKAELLRKDTLAEVERWPDSAFVVTPRPRLGTRRQLAAPDDASELLARAERERADRPGRAIRLLACLAEREPGEQTRTWELAYQALAWEDYSAAWSLFSRLARSPAAEGPAHIGLARSLEGLGCYDLALAHYELALSGCLWLAAWEPYQTEFIGFLLRRKDQLRSYGYATSRLSELRAYRSGAEIDWLVSVEWNTTGTDVDLHVQEAQTLRHCYYGQRFSPHGQLTVDIRGGFGPERYARLVGAPAGPCRLWLDYFAQDENRASTWTTALVTTWTSPGEPTERIQRRVVRLRGKGRVELGPFRSRRAPDAR